MSSADIAFINTCKDILENGSWVKDEKVRPHWEDGEPAYTIKKFGVVNRYDLSKDFPLITLRPISLKAAVDEILWIWQKKSNNIPRDRALPCRAGDRELSENRKSPHYQKKKCRSASHS